MDKVFCSAFTFGRTTGIIYGISRLIDNNITEVSPQKWQNKLSNIFIKDINYKIEDKEYLDYFEHICSLKSSKQSKINSSYLYYLINKDNYNCLNYKNNNIVDSYLIAYFNYIKEK